MSDTGLGGGPNPWRPGTGRLTALEQAHGTAREWDRHLASVFGPFCRHHPDSSGQIEILPAHRAQGIAARTGKDQHLEEIGPQASVRTVECRPQSLELVGI